MTPAARLATAIVAAATAVVMGASVAAGATSPPVVTMSPGGYFTVGTIMAADGSVPVTFKWTINAPGGICRETASVTDWNDNVYGGFDVTSDRVPTSITFHDPAYGTYDNSEPGLSVGATVTDCQGQSGSGGQLSKVFPYDNGSTLRWKFGSGWTTSNCTCWYAGSAARSTSAGQKATFTGRGRGSALLGDYAPGRGTADIYINGRKAAAINTARATTLNRAIVWQTHFNDTAVRTIEIRVTKGRVDVDAMLTSDGQR